MGGGEKGKVGSGESKDRGMYKILIRSEIKMRFLTIIGGGPSLAPVKCIFIFVCVYLQGTIFLCWRYGERPILASALCEY